MCRKKSSFLIKASFCKKSRVQIREFTHARPTIPKETVSAIQSTWTLNVNVNIDQIIMTFYDLSIFLSKQSSRFVSLSKHKFMAWPNERKFTWLARWWPTHRTKFISIGSSILPRKSWTCRRILWAVKARNLSLSILPRYWSISNGFDIQKKRKVSK